MKFERYAAYVNMMIAEAAQDIPNAEEIDLNDADVFQRSGREDGEENELSIVVSWKVNGADMRYEKSLTFGELDKKIEAIL